MSRHGRSARKGSLAGDLRPAAHESQIVTYHLADYPEIFGLYLNAFERSLDLLAKGTSVPADDGRLRRRREKPPEWHVA